MNYFKALLILFFFSGFVFGMTNYSVVSFLASHDVNVVAAYTKSEALYLIPATLVGIVAALTLPRYLSFQWCGVGLSLVYLIFLVLFSVGYAHVPQLALAFGIMGKLFPLLFIVFLWGLSNHIYSFSQACWYYPWLSLSIGIGVIFGTLVHLLPFVIHLNPIVTLAVLMGLLTGLTWWVTAGIQPAQDLPMGEGPRGWRVAWKDYIIPATLFIGGALLISKLSRYDFNLTIQQFFGGSQQAILDFAGRHAQLTGLAGLAGLGLFIGAAFFLRHKKAWGWIASAVVLVAVGLLIQTWQFFYPTKIASLQLAPIFYASIFVMIVSLLARIALTALPQDARFTALVWLEVLLIPLVRWSDAFADSLGDGLIPTAFAIWIAILIGVVLLSSLVRQTTRSQ